jgi:hypothetical protein
MTIDGGVPKAVIPLSPLAETGEPSQRATLSQSSLLMRYGGELFEPLFQSITEQLEANGGLGEDQHDELAKYLQTNNPEILAKRERPAEFIARLDSEAEAIRNEEKRLAARRAGFEKIADCLRSSIHQQMLDSGVRRIEGKLFSFCVRKNPPKVHILNEFEVPPDYISYSPLVDKTAIKSALEDGKEVPGAELVQSTRLDIR